MDIDGKPTVREFVIGGVACGALALGLTTFAEAQTTPPLVQLTHTNDVIQIIPKGFGTATNLYASPAQIANKPGYVKEGNLAAGFAVTFPNNVADMMIEPTAGNITAGNITMAAIPSDGQKACVLATATINATLNIIPNTGQTVNGNITSLAGNTTVCWTYSASNAVWDRSP